MAHCMMAAPHAVSPLMLQVLQPCKQVPAGKSHIHCRQNGTSLLSIMTAKRQWRAAVQRALHRVLMQSHRCWHLHVDPLSHFQLQGNQAPRKMEGRLKGETALHSSLCWAPLRLPGISQQQTQQQFNMMQSRCAVNRAHQPLEGGNSHKRLRALTRAWQAG